ncbi:hypothetical protein J3R83DRAFT_11360 [Lanmaoa asiatica]|nr:hypothetical protein J3R83DRAFT_11360 [Lanmaoa asiatica]
MDTEAQILIRFEIERRRRLLLLMIIAHVTYYYHLLFLLTPEKIPYHTSILTGAPEASVVQTYSRLAIPLFLPPKASEAFVQNAMDGAHEKHRARDLQYAQGKEGRGSDFFAERPISLSRMR